MAIKRGLQLSQAWWEKQGRTNLISKYQGDTFNATLWYMNMKNRFKWVDKIQNEHTGKDGGPIQTEEVTRPKFTQDEWLAAHKLTVDTK